jgi:hypothetical protein
VYFAGLGVPRDYAEAVKWYRKAADQGLAAAETNLAGMYAKGYGVEQDYAQAMQWCRKAADQGNVGAQQQIGVMYHFGYGVPKDPVQAYFWYALATVSLGSGADGHQVQRLRDQIAASLTPAQIAEAEKLVKAWKPRDETP